MTPAERLAGLRRGATATVRGPTSLLFTDLAAATRAGGWAAVVGMRILALWPPLNSAWS